MKRILLAQTGENPFGKINPPPALESGFGVIGEGPGLTGFISNGITLITLVGGIWALFNILTAGLAVISADGDPKKLGEMTDKIKKTFIGLLIMVSAPLLAALIGLFFFGDALYFLQPTLKVVGGGQ